MNSFLDFLCQHWFYSLALISAIGALAYLELNFNESRNSIDVNGLVQMINHAEPKLIDIRAQSIFNEGHINGSISMPMERFEIEFKKYLNNKINPFVIICQQGQSAFKIHKYLEKLNFKSTYLLGGMDAWKNAGMPLKQTNN